MVPTETEHVFAPQVERALELIGSHRITAAQPLCRSVAELQHAVGRSLLQCRRVPSSPPPALGGGRAARGIAKLMGLIGQAGGPIRIGAMPLCRTRFLPATIIAFQTHNPNVAIEVVEGSFAEQIEPLRDGEYDEPKLSLAKTHPTVSSALTRTAPSFDRLA